MARRSSFDILTIQTYNTALIWKDVHALHLIMPPKNLT